MEALKKTKITLLCGIGLFSFSAFAKPVKANLADAGVINEERILYWLEKRGVIDKEFSEAQKQAALRTYISKTASTGDRVLPEMVMRAERRSSHNLKTKYQLNRVRSLSSAQITETRVKVLGLLIDFPDLPHDNNQLSRFDTDMFYRSYPTEHYRNLLFSENGFNGPNGENLLSAQQYFWQASGESFQFTGDVKGWYRAQRNAEYYGGNIDDDNGNDQAVGDLVKEAVIAAVAEMSASELQSYDIEDPYDLDNDGDLQEPDGIIDHIMLFHSSVGEEAGGGVLGKDAIWSHRFYVESDDGGYVIPGTNMRAFGYTVQPIDAATGICAHEFGHDLGLPDEYDIASRDGKGSPVGSWSIMSGGSWAGDIAGAQPTGFSPYARSYLQNRYGGNWVREQEVDLNSVENNPTDFIINSAVNSDETNQISIPLPVEAVPFKSPFSGNYQYYSGEGDLIETAMVFNVSLPSSDNLLLSMKAHWDIEDNYDYVQVRVNDIVIAGNHTRSVNAINNARHIITGASSTIPSSTGEDNWVDLEFNLTAYAGQDIEISINYVTGQFFGEYGFVADDIKVLNGNQAIFESGAEHAAEVQLDGFIRTDDTLPGEPSRYIVQLRNHQGLDEGLQGEGYVPGVLVWLENLNEFDNNSSEHAGRGLIGVVDADQNLIGDLDTAVQIRDATFSLYGQTSFLAGLDEHLLNNSRFDDSDDYSAPLQSESGVVLRELGISIEVIEQAQDSSTARIRINRTNSESVDPAITASVATTVNFNIVNFLSDVSNGDGVYQYEWDFGDQNTSTESDPIHTYQESGDYTVTLTVTDSAGNSTVTTSIVTVTSNTGQTLIESEDDSNGSSGGSLSLLGLILLSGLGLRRRFK